MEGAGDLAALAIPFAAGAAAGFFLPAAAGISLSWWIPLLLLPIMVLLLAVALSGRRMVPVFATLFFLLGFFCQCTCALLPHTPGGWPPATRACAALKGTIAGIPFPHPRSSGIVQALMTGDRSGLSRETTAAFRSSGASHILALSGLHLGLIYLMVRRMTTLLGDTPAARKSRCVLILAATAFYTLMTGAGPSVVRAFLYICISEGAALSPGRRKEPARILLAALTVQLAIKPSVIGSIGFQLSYLAMLGITVLFPRLQAWYPAPLTRLEKADPMRKIWSAAVLTLSCQVFTAPLAWLRFHTFPKYFLLTNLLSLPLSGAVMTVSAATVALSAWGHCPVPLVKLDDALIECLMFVLETVSSL